MVQFSGMTLSEELTARGFVYQSTAESLADVVDGAPRTVYLGIDPTASSIHVGNLVPYMLLNHLMQRGHKVILLMGGGTALIGDPGGRSEERPFVDAAVVAEQAVAMEAGIRRFVSGDITFVNNYDWLSQLSMITFLRDVGKRFTVNAMIKKDIVANRLTDEQAISFTEFSYSLLQAYDFWYLHQTYGCDVQIGGSDQWSNILAGVEYIRKTTGDTVHALTMPLIVDKATGKKFGKSMGNAIWLDPEKTTPYQFYQFWLNTSDESVIDYLKLFTFLSLEEIAAVETRWQEHPGAREAQRTLAQWVTAFVHGAEAAASATRVSEVLFSAAQPSTLEPADVATLKQNAPTHVLSGESDVVTVLCATGLAKSNREARTFIESGAVTLDGEKVTDTTQQIELTAPVALLRRGKKQFVVLTP